MVKELPGDETALPNPENVWSITQHTLSLTESQFESEKTKRIVALCAALQSMMQSTTPEKTGAVLDLLQSECWSQYKGPKP